MQPYQAELDSIRDVLRDSPRGLTITQISKALGVNRNSAAKYLDILLMSGHVEMYSLGPAKIYHLSKRLPPSEMLSIAGSMAILMDGDLRVVHCSRPLLDMLEMTGQVLLGGRLESCLPTEFLSDELRSMLRNALRGEEHWTSSWFSRSNGQVYLQLNVRPLAFPDGSVGAAVVVHDSTSQVALEKALQDSEERFSLLTESVSEGIAILQEKSVVTANSKLLNLLGCKGMECLSEKMDALVPGWPRTVPRRADTYTTHLKRSGSASKKAEVCVNPIKYDGHHAVMILVRETAS